MSDQLPTPSSPLAAANLLLSMTNVEFGAGTSASLAGHVAGLGHSRAFIVADPGVVAAGVAEPIVAGLVDAGIDTEVFSGVDPNPTDVNVNNGVEALRNFGDGVVILLGGGSAMDAGKAIAVTAPNEGDAIEYMLRPDLDGDTIDFATMLPARLPTNPAAPIIAVPTTSGTASETNTFAVITDSAADRKLLLTADSAKPHHIVLDPALTLALPAVPTATTGMDALTHALEAYTSANPNPFSDAIALGTIEVVSRWLPIAVHDGDNLEARSQMMLAAHMAGIAFSNGPALGLVHAVGHPLSAQLHAAHGQTLSTMLPHVMRFNLDAATERYARVGLAMGVPGATGTPAAEAALATIAAIEDLSAAVGTNKTITELGGTPDMIEGLATDALRDLVILTTVRPPTRADVEELYRQAL